MNQQASEQVKQWSSEAVRQWGRSIQRSIYLKRHLFKDAFIWKPIHRKGFLIGEPRKIATNMGLGSIHFSCHYGSHWSARAWNPHCSRCPLEAGSELTTPAAWPMESPVTTMLIPTRDPKDSGFFRDAIADCKFSCCILSYCIFSYCILSYCIFNRCKLNYAV